MVVGVRGLGFGVCDSGFGVHGSRQATENCVSHPRCCFREITGQLLRKNEKRFRGGLVIKALRVSYDSTLGSRVIKKKRGTKGMLARTGAGPECWTHQKRSWTHSEEPKPHRCANVRVKPHVFTRKHRVVSPKTHLLEHDGACLAREQRDSFQNHAVSRICE